MSKKIGSFWKHKKDGKSYLTGSIEFVAGYPVKVCVFPNDKKTKDSQPDFNVVLSEPKKTEKPQDDF